MKIFSFRWRILMKKLFPIILLAAAGCSGKNDTNVEFVEPGPYYYGDGYYENGVYYERGWHGDHGNHEEHEHHEGHGGGHEGGHGGGHGR